MSLSTKNFLWTLAGSFVCAAVVAWGTARSETATAKAERQAIKTQIENHAGRYAHEDAAQDMGKLSARLERDKERMDRIEGKLDAILIAVKK